MLHCALRNENRKNLKKKTLKKTKNVKQKTIVFTSPDWHVTQVIGRKTKRFQWYGPSNEYNMKRFPGLHGQ